MILSSVMSAIESVLAAIAHAGFMPWISFCIVFNYDPWSQS